MCLQRGHVIFAPRPVTLPSSSLYRAPHFSQVTIIPSIPSEIPGWTRSKTTTGPALNTTPLTRGRSSSAQDQLQGVSPGVDHLATRLVEHHDEHEPCAHAHPADDLAIAELSVVNLLPGA